jgi:hypothetical protein
MEKFSNATWFPNFFVTESSNAIGISRSAGNASVVDGSSAAAVAIGKPPTSGMT